MKFLSMNVHAGKSMFGKYTFAKFRDALLHLSPDLVFLQEVLDGPDHLELLTKQLYPYFSFGPARPFAGRFKGNAILSKHALLTKENVNITNNRLERRAMLHSEWQLPNGELAHLLCLHWDLTHKGRLQQLDKLIHQVEVKIPKNAPLILAGDFNDWHLKIDALILAHLGLTDCHHNLHGKHAATFPSHFPFLRLDRIYLRGVGLKSVQTLSGPKWSALSDHNPLYAELEI